MLEEWENVKKANAREKWANDELVNEERWEKG